MALGTFECLNDFCVFNRLNVLNDPVWIGDFQIACAGCKILLLDEGCHQSCEAGCVGKSGVGVERDNQFAVGLAQALVEGCCLAFIAGKVDDGDAGVWLACLQTVGVVGCGITRPVVDDDNFFSSVI